MLAHPPADGANRLRAREVPDDRHDQIALFERLEQPEILVAREIASAPPLLIRHRQQIFIGRKVEVAEASTAAKPGWRRRVSNGRPIPEKREINAFKLFEI